jgi:hypothetical protein
MMLLQVLIGLVNTLFFQSMEIGILLLVVIVAFALVGIGFVALLALGYGWVRHFYATATILSYICFIAAILTFPQFVPQLLHSSNAAWALATNLWFCAALALLYSPSARAWFREARLRRQRGL